jgi:membrane associated rhomboid family serine protease
MQIPKFTLIIAAIITTIYISLSTMLFFATQQILINYGFWFGQPWNIIFHIFIHASYGHLITNLAMLLSAGFVVETIIGWKETAKIFFLGAAFSAIMFAIINPFNSLIGASGGAAALLSAAFLTNPKKTIVVAIIGTIIAFLISGGISIKIEEQKEKTKNEIIKLEQQKQQAVKDNNQQKIEIVQNQIETKTKEQKQIKQGIEITKKTKTNFEVHLFAGIFGALYMYIFKRKIVKETSKNLFLSLKKIRIKSKKKQK